jgi:hypothetical protein
MHSRILLLVLVAGAFAHAAAADTSVAATPAADENASNQRPEAAVCILTVTGDREGSPAVNFTCSGPVVKAYVNRDVVASPVVSQGVDWVDQLDDCGPSLDASWCIIALCSREPTVILDQGSHLVGVVSSKPTLCIGGDARVGMYGVTVANNSLPANVRENDIGPNSAAVRIAGNSRVVIASCAFLGNYYALVAQDNGSARLRVTDSKFTENYALKDSYAGGSAMYVGADCCAAVNISDSSFSNNFVTGVGSGGGAMYTGSSNMTLHNVSFVKNYVVGAMAAGGAIWVDAGVKVNVSNSNFTGNWVEGDASEGGAIYARTLSVVSVLGGLFQGNRVYGERTRGRLYSLRL